MKKILCFYWYVPPTYWHPIYNLHLRNLMAYRDVFDEVNVVISADGDSNGVNETIESIRYVLPNAKFTIFKNDKESRESSFFYEQIVKKLGDFDDNDAIFFAHNKGVDSTYVGFNDRVAWIDSMYYFNLYDREKIDSLLNDETTCTIGTGKMINYCPPAFVPFCKHRWMFSGTFFWIVPRRIDRYIKNNGVEVKPNMGRYYAEGFLGMIFPENADEVKHIGCKKVVTETWIDYLERNLTDKNIYSFAKTHGVPCNNRNLDIFVFAHKQFDTTRKNPVYKIVCSNDCDIYSNSLGVMKLDCELSNIGFSEWQKIYEIYKNKRWILKKYVGLAHYHRYLKFSDDVNFVPNMDEEIEKCDCAIKLPCDVGNLRLQYDFCHNVKDYDIMMQIIAEEYPDFIGPAKAAENRGLLIDSNILILRKEDFLGLCDFVFSVLLKYCKKVGIDPTSDESFINYMKSHEEDYAKNHLPDDNEHFQQARICSFLAERLVIIYLTRRNFTLRMYDMVEK